MQVARCHDYFVTHNIAFTQTYQLSRSAFHGEKSISSLTFRPDDCRARCKISLIHRRSHDLSRRSLSLRLKISRFWSFRMSVVTQRSDSLCDTHPRQLLWHSEHESIIPFPNFEFGNGNLGKHSQQLFLNDLVVQAETCHLVLDQVFWSTRTGAP